MSYRLFIFLTTFVIICSSCVREQDEYAEKRWILKQFALEIEFQIHYLGLTS
jgi:hypothetical protein